MAAVEQLHMPLTLDIGGATVDASEIQSLTWAKGTKDLPRGFSKGSEVRLTVIARVVGVKGTDKYDSHDNISETVRGHFLRVDEVETCELVSTDNFRTVADAAADEAQAAADAATEGEAN